MASNGEGMYSAEELMIETSFVGLSAGSAILADRRLQMTRRGDLHEVPWRSCRYLFI